MPGQSCPDRAEQIPGDPYSPPCIQFSGDNGGATAKGVTMALTDNDESNAPMLAVNDKLGYEPVATRLVFSRRSEP